MSLLYFLADLVLVQTECAHRMKKCIKCQVTITKKIRQGKKSHLILVIWDALIGQGINGTFSGKTVQVFYIYSCLGQKYSFVQHELRSNDEPNSDLTAFISGFVCFLYTANLFLMLEFIICVYCLLCPSVFKPVLNLAFSVVTDYCPDTYYVLAVISSLEASVRHSFGW